MPKVQIAAVIIVNAEIGPSVYKMTIKAPELASQAQAGQFVHVKPVGILQPLLRRPLSIADIDAAAGTLTLIYRIVGAGTEQLAALTSGELLDCIGPLGRGFELTGEKPLLIGGGMGIAPLIFLARSLCPRPIELLIGGRSENEMFWPGLFENLCDSLHITTDDGTAGVQGTTVDLLPHLLEKNKFDVIYTCGPRIMMENIAKLADGAGIPCYVSLEAHMACGVGACLSCTCEGTDKVRRKICSDGPVFKAQEVFAL